MKTSLNHMSQLDGLRAIAVASVIFHHLFFTTLNWTGIFGGFGVRLFFVLSGFLITRILLDARGRAESGESQIGHALKVFWARRALRIFPLYFGTVLLLAVFSLGEIHQLWPWLMTFTSNFYMTTPDRYAIPVSHFWSLAVEEQFYFVWPFLILLLPRKALLPTMLFVLALGPAFRILVGIAGWPDEVRWYATPASFDALSMGAILAWLQAQGEKMTAKTWQWSRLFLPVSILIFFGAQFMRFHNSASIFERFAETGESFMFVLLVGCASIGFRGHFGTFLNWAPIQRIGKLSYGLYVYHVLVWYFAHFYLFTPKFLSPNLAAERIFILIVTYLVAAISWQYFERPILRFKSLFPYQNRQPAKRVFPVQSQISLRRN